MNSSLCLRCALSRSILPARFPVKRSLSTTRLLKKKPSHSLPHTPDASNVPAKVPHPVKASESQTKKFGPADIKPYTPEEKARLAKKYTPAQLSAIEAGEAAVSPEDLYEQGVVRQDSFRLEYQSDDLSKIMPVLDKPIMAPEENYDPNLRLKTTDEIASDLADFLESASEKTTHVDYLRFIDNMRLTVGKEEAERNSPSYEAPEIPRGIPALEAVVPPKDTSRAVAPRTKQLMLQTGYKADMLTSLRVRILVIHRVVNQTRLGKIQSMYYLAVAGNGKGLLGIGEGKAAEALDAVTQAKNNAIKNMQPIPRYEKRTIFGDIRIKVGAVELELMSRPPGFGVRCQHLIYEMCKCAGIHDLAARVTRSRNNMNTIKATFKALVTQRVPDEIARGLGRKLVDVRKVYYGGNVL